MKRIFCISTICIFLSGCTTMSPDLAMPILQADTAKMLGLGSSEELTITNVSMSKRDALGSQMITYRATTAKGRILDCEAQEIPGLLMQPAAVSTPTCKPIKTY
ncbi:hypothetical protein ARC272_11645 [Pantoea ananatis]|nr:hypothetical protein ARC272_11645 [Pantoea ananatis]